MIAPGDKVVYYETKEILAKRIPVEKIGEFLDRQISIENKRK